MALLCPSCRYDLTGLEPPHRCPECGQAFDERTQVWWGADGNWWAALEYATVLLGVGMLIWGVVPRLKFGVGWDVRITVMLLALIGFLVGLALVRHRAAQRRGVCVAITPDGLLVRSPRVQECVPWRDFRDVVFSEVGHYVRLRGSDRSIILPYVITESETEAFTEAVMEAADAYIGPAAGSANTDPASPASEDGTAASDI